MPETQRWRRSGKRKTHQLPGNWNKRHNHKHEMNWCNVIGKKCVSCTFCAGCTVTKKIQGRCHYSRPVGIADFQSRVAGIFNLLFDVMFFRWSMFLLYFLVKVFQPLQFFLPSSPGVLSWFNDVLRILHKWSHQLQHPACLPVGLFCLLYTDSDSSHPKVSDAQLDWSSLHQLMSVTAIKIHSKFH